MQLKRSDIEIDEQEHCNGSETKPLKTRNILPKKKRKNARNKGQSVYNSISTKGVQRNSTTEED